MMRLVIATAGDTENGLGHVSRSLVLARALGQCGVSVWFQTRRHTPGAVWLERAGYPVLYCDEPQPAATGYLIDVEHGPDRAWLERARADYPRVIVVAGNGYTLQDYAAVRDLADLEVYQGLDAMPGEKAVSGVEYVLIDPVYARCRAALRGPVVVSLGGGDPHRLTEPVLAALAGLARPVIAAVGPARPSLTGTYPGVTVVEAPPTLAPYLHGAALLVGAFGTVAWEALAAGVPGVLTGWSAQHVDAMEQLEHMGLAVSLGLWSALDPARLRAAVEQVLGGRHWPTASKRARELVDGQGAARVAARIVEALR
jgi:UDP:flavonoid glycosyltransferase YjiC (YdhE family)